MSCNGCRVLRKGCSDDCTIRPCLQWIKSADSQANATMFLAKFYGRAGLINLINAGPAHLRPAIFRSLLYEACGRIINPIYGSVGLLWSGNWAQCQSAVDSVLKGTSEFMQAPSSASSDLAAAMTAAPQLVIPAPSSLKDSCDIRHIKKSSSSMNSSSDLLYLDRHPSRQSKRAKHGEEPGDGSMGGLWIYPAPIYEEKRRRENISTEDESNYSDETIEESLVLGKAGKGARTTEQIWKFDAPTVDMAVAAENHEITVGLDLTLGVGCD
ncbi:hypothetical protein SAY86_025959 [Trapa natans]|uniref:LOB domain-containing protein n=1 Tax=Trapa natans TaxID=22666 RepID=A0AAN7QE60_TRANT|nr:hypothetical protein SAY86_025959 [Trapa natans]